MTTYRISQNETIFTVDATSFEEAATKAARKILNTRSQKIQGIRVTGDHGKSGMFNAYESTANGMNSRGSNYHISEI